MTRLLRSVVLTFLLLWTAPTQAAIVAHAFSGNAVANTSASSVSVTVGANIPAGSAIYVLVYEYSAPNSGIGYVADSAGSNTYTELSGGVSYLSGNTQIFQCFNCSALTFGHTITYTAINSGADIAMSVFYVTGLTATNPYDSATLTTATFPTGSAPTATQSGTPSVAGELFISLAGWTDFVTTAGYSLDTSNGWTASPPNSIESSDGFGYYFGVAGGIQINSGTGKLTTQPTFGNTTVRGGIIILGLKPAATASSPFFFKPFP